MKGIEDGVLGIGHRLLHGLRRVLEREYGESAAAALQEAGFLGADELFEHFTGWVARRTGVEDPADIRADELGGLLAEFFRGLGWGAVAIERVGDGGLAVDTPDWAEADPHANALTPGCHLTAGLLAGFLGRLAGEDIAVMEVECRTRNDSRCRFLAGSPETLQRVYETVNAGGDYLEALHR